MIKRVSFILSILLFACVVVKAQVQSESVEVFFRQGRAIWEPSFQSNNKHLQQFVGRIRSLQADSASYLIHKVYYYAYCSPEGSAALNKRLAYQRATSISRMLKKQFSFSDDMVEVRSVAEDWSGLQAYVANDHLVPHRDEVLALIQSLLQDVEHQEHYKQQLIALHGGDSWRYMNKHFFPQLRRFRVDVYMGNRAPEEWEVEKREETKHFEALPSPQAYELPQTLFPAPQQVQAVEMPVSEVVAATPAPSPRALYVKSNAVAWAMLIANVGVEVQLSDRWSAALPVYFSAANYFTRTLKFRTLCFQPEVRYWIPQVKGLFAGAHFSLAWYNYANGGAYRYQDHGRHTPLYGGGLGVGYRKPLGRSDKWHVEFSLGAGAYPLHYDIFRNEPNGKLVGSKKRTFVGIDHVGVTFSYRFDLKGGKP